ncbi:battenin-like [Gigantopelta aegis]|uniref:battenin-like n=1 Tax=Gigantopelta aegis TaxID=1735272 RepID=UPI001B88C1C9|nr:battenin-like [Gigantopelta aegis]
MDSDRRNQLSQSDLDNADDYESTPSIRESSQHTESFDDTRVGAPDGGKWQTRRNLVGFWILGLCNNFAYVVMLSAAHDILKEQQTADSGHDFNITTTTVAPNPNKTQFLQCNKIGTGAILLADIVPALIIKLSAPLFVEYLSYRFKIILVTLFNAASFIIVALSHDVSLSLFGVVCASVSSGMGEITFLAYSSFFPRNVVSTWSSGTGGAGIFGSLVYAGFTAIGFSPRNSVLVQVIVPVIMLLCFLFMLRKPEPVISEDSDSVVLLHEDKQKNHTEAKLTVRQKLQLVLPLLKYILPLLTVYFAEYFINQGLLELLYFNNTWLTPAAQYRWYQVAYQLGVFISRSSVNLVQFNKLWILTVLQFVNMILLLVQVFYHFIPSMWILIPIILYEGLLGGAAYVNTFYKMSVEVPAEHLEFSMGVVSISDTLGVSLVGLVAIPTHDHICSLKIRMSG